MSPTAYKSPLHQMTQTTPTCLWNDSAAIDELTYSLSHGAVGATCNPVIALGILKRQGITLDREYLRQWAETLHVRDLLEQAFLDAGV